MILESMCSKCEQNWLKGKLRNFVTSTPFPHIFRNFFHAPTGQGWPQLFFLTSQDSPNISQFGIFNVLKSHPTFFFALLIDKRITSLKD